MSRTFHVISGLPRSGSTLLSAILRQNPRFHAAMTSPVASLFGQLATTMSGGTPFGVFFDDERRRQIFHAVLSGYYFSHLDKSVVFDTSRTWTGKIATLTELFPSIKIICCVRDIGWIIDSIERLLRKNPLQTSRLFNFKVGNSVYSRSEMLMNSETGIIGSAWSTLREAWFSQYDSHLIIIDYERLAQEPLKVMNSLYELLKEKRFSHDFNHVLYDEPDYDV